MTSRRSVWLLTRPLRPLQGRLFPNFLNTPAFSHWGVLVTDRPSNDLSALVSARNNPEYTHESLGALWELKRTTSDTTRDFEVQINDPFELRHLLEGKEWGMFSMEYVGETLLSQEELEMAGKPCI
jgi:hypothetical protein